jgi:NitT/TauT family transport system permease protein
MPAAWVRRGASTLNAILVLAAAFALWQLGVVLFHIKPFLLPAPSIVLLDLISRPGWYLGQARTSVIETMAGFLGAIVLGLLLAVGVVYSRTVERTAYTLLVTLNAIPKIALAPLFILWLGTEYAPKIAIGLTLAIFPIVISSVLGLRSVEPDMLDLARSMRASRLQVLWKIRVPNALPSIFAGLKVAITLAFSGAIVGEFIASDSGLGHVIVSSQANFDTTPMFAAIVLLALIGTVMFFAIELIEHLTLGWHVSRRRAGNPVLV